MSVGRSTLSAWRNDERAQGMHSGVRPISRSLLAFATFEPGGMPFARAVMRPWRGPIALQELAVASRTR